MRWGSLLCTLFILGLMSGSAHGQDILHPADTISYPENSAVGISPDASHILVIEPEGKTTVYDSSGSVLLTTQFEGEPIFMPSAQWRRPIVWSDDNSSALLFSHSTLYWLDVSAGNFQEVASFPGQWIIKAGFFQGVYLIVSIGRDIDSSFADQQMVVLDKATFEEVLPFSPDDSCLLGLPADPLEQGLVRLMREESYFQCYRPIEWNADQTQYLRWSYWNSSPPDTINVYDVDSDEPRLQLRHCARETNETPCRLADLEAVNWSPDGTRIVSLPGYNGQELIKVWDAFTGDLLYALQPVSQNGDGNYPVAMRFRDDSQQILVIINGGIIFIWDLASGELRYEWHHDDSQIFNAQWIYDNELVIQWGKPTPWSRTAGVIWDADTGEKLALIASPASPGTALNQVIEDQRASLLLLVWSTQIEIFDLNYLATVWRLDTEN